MLNLLEVDVPKLFKQITHFLQFKAMKTSGLFIFLMSVSVAAIGEFFAPLHVYFILTAALIILDTLTGVSSSVLYNNQTLDPDKWRKVLNKLIQYSAAIIVGGIATYVLKITGDLETDKIVLGSFGYIMSAELISIYGHIKHSTGIDFSKFIPGLKKPDNKKKQ